MVVLNTHCAMLIRFVAFVFDKLATVALCMHVIIGRKN